MGKIKGCGNESCESHKKKLIYKDPEAFCSKCGKPLVYVCKDCYRPVPTDTDKYCARCHAKHEDRKDKFMKGAAVVFGGAVTVGGVMLKYGKKVFDVVKTFKG